MTRLQQKRPPVALTTEGPSIDLEANATPIYRTSGAAAKESLDLQPFENGRRRLAGNEDGLDCPPGFTAAPIWELGKREGLIRAGEREYKGARFFELRLWASEGATPTGKGVTIPCEAVSGLARALTAYAAALDSSAPQDGS